MADSRNEDLLENILGGSNEYGEPLSRNEAILQNILGEDNELLPPVSRIEELLLQLKDAMPSGEIEITENGEYDVTAYETATVNVAGGGADIDYTYLPNSVKENVKASFSDIMISYMLLQGSPIQGILPVSNLPYITQDGALFNGGGFYCDLGEINTNATCYFAGKSATSGADGFPLSVPYSHNPNNCPLFYYPTFNAIQYSNYSNDQSISGAAQTSLHVLAISVNAQSKKTRFFYDGTFLNEIGFTNSGNRVTFMKDPILNQFAVKGYLKYGGVVLGVETDETIIANMQTIMTKVGLN